MKPTVKFRPTTYADIMALYKKRPTESIRAITATIDDEPVAIAGIKIHENFNIAFRHTTEDARNYPIATYKLAMHVLKLLKETKGPVFARPDPNVEKAIPFLLHLGFECIDKDKEIYQWIIPTDKQQTT